MEKKATGLEIVLREEEEGAAAEAGGVSEADPEEEVVEAMEVAGGAPCLVPVLVLGLPLQDTQGVPGLVPGLYLLLPLPLPRILYLCFSFEILMPCQEPFPKAVV